MSVCYFLFLHISWCTYLPCCPWCKTLCYSWRTVSEVLRNFCWGSFCRPPHHVCTSMSFNAMVPLNSWWFLPMTSTPLLRFQKFLSPWSPELFLVPSIDLKAISALLGVSIYWVPWAPLGSFYWPPCYFYSGIVSLLDPLKSHWFLILTSTPLLHFQNCQSTGSPELLLIPSVDLHGTFRSVDVLDPPKSHWLLLLTSTPLLHV